MENGPVRIRYNHSPNPDRYRTYTVTCYPHHVIATVTSTPAVVRYWLYRVRCAYYYHIRAGRLVVGLGVQWHPTKPCGPPATLQLCVGSKCLIYQLAYSDTSPRSLRRFLENPQFTFVGVGNNLDRKMLENYSLHKLDVCRLIELREVAAGKMGLPGNMSMEKLAESILKLYGIAKPVEVGRSNWEAYMLAEEQVEYACMDAFISFLLGITLRVWDWVEN